MSFLDDLKAQAKDLLWDDDTITGKGAAAETPVPTETAAIQRDEFDSIAYDVLKRQTQPLQRNVNDLVDLSHQNGADEDDESAGDTYEDVFNLLNQGAPLLEDASKIAPSHQVNHQVMQELLNNEDVQALRKETAHDRYQTLFTMLTMREQIQESYVTVQEAVQQQRQAQQDLQNAMQSGNQQGLQDAIAGVEQANQNAQNAAQQAADQMAQGAQQAKQDINSTSDALGGFGLGDGEVQRLDYDDRRKLVERLNNNRMKRLADMIGSFRSFGKAERRKKVKHSPAETFEYVLSNDLSRLVPEELNNLGVPELEEMFWLRWAQHGLLTRQIKGPAKAGQGPIIVVCDESSSMNETLGRGETREMWSKAVSLALFDAAAKGKRDFTYIGFSSGSTIYEYAFPKGKANLAEITSFTEHFAGGGTNPSSAMARAFELIMEADKRDYDRPDVVIISDGDFSIDEDFVTTWQTELERLDAKAYGVQIGNDGYGRTALPDLTDHVINITSLNATPEGVQQLFAEI